MSFGSQLKSALEQRDLSQTDLAKELGCSRSVINKYCTNKGAPSLEQFKNICSFLEVSADDLLEIPKTQSEIEELYAALTLDRKNLLRKITELLIEEQKNKG